MTRSTIYEVLREDHRAVSQLLLEAEGAATGDEREELLSRIADELSAHSEAESLTFYAALREHPETQQLVDDAEREHEQVSALLDELDSTADEDETAQRMRRLKELVDRHVQEEESEIFESARTVLGDDEARALGERFREEKGDRLNGGEPDALAGEDEIPVE